MNWQQMWRFDTKRFAVVWEITECLDNPRETFCDEADIEAIENGSLTYFDSRVRVLLKTPTSPIGNGSSRCARNVELGCDYLGANACDDPASFKDHFGLAAKSRADNCNYGSYFTDMVREAIRDARHTLKTAVA